jgi:hypothetical protein
LEEDEDLVIFYKSKFGKNGNNLLKKEEKQFSEENIHREGPLSFDRNQRLISTIGTHNLTSKNGKQDYLSPDLSQTNTSKAASNDNSLETISRRSNQIADSEDVLISQATFDNRNLNKHADTGKLLDSDEESNIQKNLNTVIDSKEKQMSIDFNQEKNSSQQGLKKEEENISTTNEKVDDPLSQENKSILNVSGAYKSDDTKPFIEEFFFRNKSNLDFNEDEMGPPLEDSEVEFLPEEEKEYLVQRQKIGIEGNNNSHHQRLIPIFGMGSSKKGKTNRGALTDPNSKWSNCQVPYSIGKKYSKQERAVIKGAMSQFAKETGINWVPRTAANKDFVSIRRESGCFSDIGRGGGAQTMSLGKIITRVTVFSSTLLTNNLGL